MAKWIEALKLTAHGLSAKQVADKMGTSIQAVVKSLARARKKMNAKTTTEAVYKAAKSGLICILILAELDGAIGDFARINRTRTRRAPSQQRGRISRVGQRSLRRIE